MQFTEEHRAFRKMVRDFVEREIQPYVEEWEQAGIFPALELFPKLGELGLLGLEYAPRDLGVAGGRLRGRYRAGYGSGKGYCDTLSQPLRSADIHLQEYSIVR